VQHRRIAPGNDRRAGEQESRIAGEQESRRAGEQESRRAGEQESGLGQIRPFTLIYLKHFQSDERLH